MAEPVRGLHLRDRPPGRPVRPGEAQRQQLVVGLVGVDPALRRLHPLLDLVHKRINVAGPAGRCADRPASITGRDMRRDRVMGTTSQLGSCALRPGQVISSKNLHDLSVRLHVALLGHKGFDSTPNIEPEERPPTRQARVRTNR